MAVRQYIGARYVPKFMGTYDATQVYEALSVVDNGLGTSYISKIPTPAGTPLSNTTYWALYGATSGAIISLQDQIDALNDYIYGKRIVIIADSYGVLPAGNTMIDKVKALANADGFTDVYDFSAGNVGIYHAGANGNALTMLQNNAANIPDHDTITDVVFAVGINDIGDTIADVTSAYSSLASYVESEYPNAHVLFAWCGSNATQNLATRKSMIELIRLMEIKCGEFKNWHFLDGMQYIMHDHRNMASDNVHPNSTGAPILGEYLWGAIKNRSSVHYNATNTSDATTSSNVTVSDAVTEIIDGEVTHIIFNQIEDLTANWYTMSRSSWVNIIAVPDNMLVNSPATITATIPVNPQNTTSQCAIAVRYRGGNLAARSVGVGNTAYPDGITFEAFSLTMPTIMT